MTIKEAEEFAASKGYRFWIKHLDEGQSWKIEAPDGRIFGRWIPAETSPDNREKEIVTGIMETIRCVEENVFPCQKQEAIHAG